MGDIYLGPTAQYYGAGSSGAKIKLSYLSSRLGSFLDDLKNSISYPVNVSSSARSNFTQCLNWILDNNTCNYFPSGWTYNMLQSFQIFNANSDDISYWNNNIAGHSFEIYLPLRYTPDSQNRPFYHFRKSVMPAFNQSGNLDVQSDYCIFDDYLALFPSGDPNDPYLNIPHLSNSWSDSSAFGQKNDLIPFSTGYVIFDYDSSGGGGDDCSDSRSSLSTSEFLITINGRSPNSGNVSHTYNLLIQPDSQHTSGSISLSSSDGLFGSLTEFYGASVRMLDSVCCHDVGYIDIYGDVYAFCFDYTDLADVLIPIPKILDEQNVLLLRARFDDECCCYATGYSDELTDFLNNYFNSLSSDFNHSISINIQPKSIAWNGFARLTDFCCDDSDCSEDDYEYEIEYPPNSGGGGGDNVDISCICDGLTALTTALSGKLDSLIEGQGIIAEAIEGIDVSVDNECVCDNLEAIKESIDDLELSVTNSPQITVSPCQPIVTNPVNNITVTPSTAQITNPVTVTPCDPNITINPSALNIDMSGVEAAISGLGSSISSSNDGLMCDDESLACILKAALNRTDIVNGQSVNKSITDTIHEKELSTYNETVVEPCNYTYTRWASHDIDND